MSYQYRVSGSDTAGARYYAREFGSDYGSVRLDDLTESRGNPQFRDALGLYRSQPLGSLLVVQPLSLLLHLAASPVHDPTRKHAVASTSNGWSFGYDPNGNMTSGRGATIGWTTYDKPSSIAIGAQSSAFSYRPDRGYWKQVAQYAGGSETTVYIGDLLEKVTSAGGVDYRHRIAAGTGAVIVTRSTGTNNATYYVSMDHLGSYTAISNGTPASVVSESYSAYGQRRGSNWTGAPTTPQMASIANVTRRGFTGHTELDNLNLIHMNGRVYDPAIGRFLSADPFVDQSQGGQGLNRYSYVGNNPLTFADPTGFETGGDGPSITDITVTGHWDHHADDPGLFGSGTLTTSSGMGAPSLRGAEGASASVPAGAAAVTGPDNAGADSSEADIPTVIVESLRELENSSDVVLAVVGMDPSLVPLIKEAIKKYSDPRETTPAPVEIVQAPPDSPLEVLKVLGRRAAEKYPIEEWHWYSYWLRGIYIHAEFERLVAELGGAYRAEVSFKGGVPVRRGLPGSVRADATYGFDPTHPEIVVDLKTANAFISQADAERYFANFPKGIKLYALHEE